MSKPSKFIWRNNKTIPGSGDTKDTVTPIQQKKVVGSPFMTLPRMKPAFTKKSTTHSMVPKNEIYELSTIDDNGVYLNTSLDSQHDHWVDIVDNNEDRFILPSRDCLTTLSGQPHRFYTPSSIMIFA